MPRLITQRKKRRRIPPCGRLIEYRSPHSPFQKLIDSARHRQRISVRELARRIRVSQSTLWIWLHNENGFPHPKAFKPEHVERLSRSLKLSKRAIERAVDASRHVYTAREKPLPHPPLDAFRNFIEIMEHDRRQTISRSYVVNLAKRLYSGALRR
jgi:transcriptional regulator with XRE-family HTH domain